jgi:hypothetical protein
VKRANFGFLFAMAVATTVCADGIKPSSATPVPRPSQTAPPDAAAPSPTIQPLRIGGQIVDYERGYIVFASGDAFKLAPTVVAQDAKTGMPPVFSIDPGVYAVATLNLPSGLVTSVRVSRTPLAEGTPAAQVPRRYVLTVSTPQPNQDLYPAKSIYSSPLTPTETVTVVVQVPANTPYTDDVFLATDTSGWNPQAIKTQRMDGLHFRIQFELKGGTDFHYLFTRGSWQTVERDRAGLARKPRDLYVAGGAAQDLEATVFRWADIP